MLISPNLNFIQSTPFILDIHIHTSLNLIHKPLNKPPKKDQNFICFSSNSNHFQTHPHHNYSPPSCSDNNSNNIGNSYAINGKNLGTLLHYCNTLKEVKRLHGVVTKCCGVYLDNNLISGYVRMGCLSDARKVFDEMRERNVVSWTAMLGGYLKHGFEDEALRLFVDFVESGIQANSKTLVCLLNLCSRRVDFELGRQLHACVFKGNFGNLIVESAVVYFYSQCGRLDEAFRVFDRMRERDVVCWTTIITACSQHGQTEDAFMLFSRMLSDGFAPNEFTVCSVLKACGEEKALKFGRQLHGTIFKKLFKNDVFLETSLVDMYAKCGVIEDSRIVFDGMRRRNMVTWTSIIAGYARNNLGEEAINLFRVMKRRNIYVNKLTMVSLIRACGSIRALQTGKELHAQILKNNIEDNIYIASTLVWLYCKCGDYSCANYVLERMTFRDVVSWTAMISGCARLGHESESLEYLKEMLGEGVVPNPFTFSSALKACARLENVWHGKLIHSSISKSPALSNVFVGSALINMYSKCGYVEDALEVFDSMPEKNLVSWKAMIVGYAKNGLCREAMKLMYRMEAEGIEVDDYILATVLTACGDFEWKDDEHPSKYRLQSNDR
uniref:pentatricopeptide repeat-containing protein At4g18520, chloroplastic-like n=1 Tax=Erigeron canadensis TaxID=72917 RepID=UPI001CB922DB|nr:pentatricopeptide repeat-containing protein At4g18520, chloroplastic-like [Erigeron canadensis]